MPPHGAEFDWTSCPRQAWMCVPWVRRHGLPGASPRPLRPMGLKVVTAPRWPVDHRSAIHDDEEDELDKVGQQDAGQDACDESEHGCNEGENSVRAGAALLGFEDRFTRKSC